MKKRHKNDKRSPSSGFPAFRMAKFNSRSMPAGDEKMERDWFYSTVCVDIDGVLVDTRKCTEKCDYNGYPREFEQLKRKKCPMKPGSVEAMKELKSRGYRIILHTARTSNERSVTEKWLQDHGIIYDFLVMDKPIGFIYIDDLGYRFKEWDATLKDIFSDPELRCERDVSPAQE